MREELKKLNGKYKKFTATIGIKGKNGAPFSVTKKEIKFLQAQLLFQEKKLNFLLTGTQKETFLIIR